MAQRPVSNLIDVNNEASNQVQERTPEFWGGLVNKVKHAITIQDVQLRALLGRRHCRLTFVCSRASRISPSIHLHKQNALKIDFPEGFFLWTDEAARFMIEDARYRNSLSICRAWPQADPSHIFHLLWSLWIALHEISHYLCGHLNHLAIKDFIELEAAGTTPLSADERLLRESMEVDADIYAARMFFGAIGRQSVLGNWDAIYHSKESGRLLMQDLALIFLPLFMLIGRSEPDDPNRRVHPRAFHRLVLFQIFGLTGYREGMRSGADEHPPGFGAGLRRACELLLHIEGTMLHGDLSAADYIVHKKALLAANMDKKRLVDMPNDWLRKERRSDSTSHRAE